MRSSVALLLLAAFVFADDTELTAVDRKVMQALTERTATKHIVFHYEPDLPKSKLKKAMALNRSFFDALEKKLRMRYEGQVHLFLHSSEPRLRELTDTGAYAFSTGTRSVHQPHDYDDAHELAHSFAL